MLSLGSGSWLLVVCLLVSACQRQPEIIPVRANSPIAWNDLERAGNGRLFYQGAPFTGVAIRKNEDGSKRVEAQFKNGQLHGAIQIWAGDHFI